HLEDDIASVAHHLRADLDPESLVTAVAFILISVCLASAGQRCASKQVGNVCLAPQKEAVLCCCKVFGGNMCCAQQGTCVGGVVIGCACTGKNEDEDSISRVSARLRN